MEVWDPLFHTLSQNLANLETWTNERQEVDKARGPKLEGSESISNFYHLFYYPPQQTMQTIQVCLLVTRVGAHDEPPYSLISSLFASILPQWAQAQQGTLWSGGWSVVQVLKESKFKEHGRITPGTFNYRWTTRLFGLPRPITQRSLWPQVTSLCTSSLFGHGTPPSRFLWSNFQLIGF